MEVAARVKERNISRRNFLKILGTAGAVGVGAAVGGCASQPAGGKGWMPNQYNGPANWSVQVKGRIPLDNQNPAIQRDDKKCILCGQCLEVCKHVMSVYGYYELPLKNEIVCVHCGQCTLWCPTGAITEKKDITKVMAALENADRHVVIQTAPATKVSLGEEFGLPPGSIVEGKQVAALKALGFKGVFDTSFAADLTIMEEASEFLERREKSTEPLPQFTSCCPGWVKFLEYYYPDLLPHLSTCKSPQQMLGAVAKTYYAKQKQIAPETVFSVAVMLCTAKKFECQRPQLQEGEGYPAGLADVDAVLTTRELAELLKKKGIDLARMPEQPYDSLMGESTGAGVIFGTTGGVTEAAVRTAYYLACGQAPPAELLNWSAVRGLAGVKEAAIAMPGVGTIKVAVCHGLKNARTLLQAVREKKASWHFIEFMACPGGCIGGGGQPRTSLPPTDELRKARLGSMYTLDGALLKKRCSYQNQEVRQLYDNWLEHPLSEQAKTLLHTRFTDRSSQLTIKA